MRFENPTNGYVETESSITIWFITFLLGPLGLCIYRQWGAAFLLFIFNLLLAATIVGPFILNFVVALLAPSAVERSYLRAGWRRVPQ